MGSGKFIPLVSPSPSNVVTQLIPLLRTEWILIINFLLVSLRGVSQHSSDLVMKLTMFEAIDPANVTQLVLFWKTEWKRVISCLLVPPRGVSREFSYTASVWFGHGTDCVWSHRSKDLSRNSCSWGRLLRGQLSRGYSRFVPRARSESHRLESTW